MKPKVSPLQKYHPLWEGAKSVMSKNAKVGYKIGMYAVNKMNEEFSKNQASFPEEDKQKLIEMVKNLKEIRNEIGAENCQCSLEEYQEFLNDFFTQLDYEDRHKTVTMKTVTKFKLMIQFIEVLGTMTTIDQEMRSCQKYCKFKAIDIFKSLKKGEVPKRGGPKEEEGQGDDALGNEIEQMSLDHDKNNHQHGSNINDQNIGGFNANYNKGFDNQKNQSNSKDINNFDFNSGFNQGNNFNSQQNNNFSNHQNNNFNNQQNNNFNNQQNINFNNQQNINFNNQQNINFNNQQNINFNNQQNINSNINHPKNLQNNNFNNQQNSKPAPQQNNNLNKKPSQSSSYDAPVVPAGPRTQKVTQDPKDPKKKVFHFKATTMELPVPLKPKTIDYFKLLDNIKKNNEEALKVFKKGKKGERNKEVLNLIEDSLEFLSYIEN